MGSPPAITCTDSYYMVPTRAYLLYSYHHHHHHGRAPFTGSQRQVRQAVQHSTFDITKTNPPRRANKTQKILNHRHKSPGSSNRLIYIRRHISTFGDAQFAAERRHLASNRKWKYGCGRLEQLCPEKETKLFFL